MGDLGEYTSAAPDSALPCSSNASPTCNDVPIIRTSFPERQSRKGLKFTGLCVDVAEKKQILWNVSGHASHGRVLAVMGPSGSGKTTLLSALAGYSNVRSGEIYFNGAKLTKKMKRRISYVLQADIFFPNLTLRETLRYSALLRLPREYSFKEKLSKVEDIINVLRLTDCANTYVGNASFRGLSGGELKRASIGCEMLTDPSMLLLDEPTSGLDSTSAFILMETLCKLAKEKNKVVIASIHQPSSQLYHMCDDLMLLAKGKVAYFGEAANALPYFASRGLECALQYNPADYMLEMVSQDESRKLLMEDPVQETASQSTWWKKLPCWARKASGDVEENPGSADYPLPTISTEIKVEDGHSHTQHGNLDGFSRKWPTSWFWQLLVLTVRTFRQSRHVILSKLNFTQTIVLAVIVSVIWFQVPDDERSVNDRHGYFFFVSIFWAFQPLIVATLSLPAEHNVISKERRSGSYHLSAYYLAKLFSELPLVIILPSIFYIITYWCGGFNGWTSFFAIWFVVLINSIVAQGLGVFIGALFMDYQRSLVAAAVVMLTFMLLGGFYIERLPPWLVWAQYLSFISYTFRAMLEYGYLDLDLRCDSSGISEYDACNFNSNNTNLFFNDTFVSGAEVYETIALPLPWYGNVLVAIGFGITFRFCAYLALRFLHTKNNN